MLYSVGFFYWAMFTPMRPIEFYTWFDNPYIHEPFIEGAD